MRIRSTPQPQDCLNIIKTNGKAWAHSNRNDVSKSHSVPAVGILWRDQKSTDPDRDPCDLQQYNNSYYSLCQGSTPTGGHVIIGIMDNQVFVILELPRWAKSEHQINNSSHLWRLEGFKTDEGVPNG
eukprot:6834248-Heterocapsa_arctica.AAC.1